MSYGGYQSGYQGGSFNNRGSQRSNYENNGYSRNQCERGGGQPGMQTMEILSGKEYGYEYESDRSTVVKNRWAVYMGLGLLLLIAILAPRRDETNANNAKLLKNQTSIPSAPNVANPAAPTIKPLLEDDDNIVQGDDYEEEQGDDNDEDDDHSTMASPPTSPTTSATTAPQQAPTATTTTTTNLHSASPPYVATCNLSSAFQMDANNFTFLNVSNFCPTETAPGECHCVDPVQPVRPTYSVEEWPATMNMNIGLVNKTLAVSEKNPLDVVFLGDSITEHWNGRDMGRYREKDFNASVVFDKLFQKKNGSSLEGLALGIAGDRCQSLLYRLQNGEMPEGLNPKVWWILIGTNDLHDLCRADSITAGNIRIIEEIRRKHPSAPIVINSLLPRARAELLRRNPSWDVLRTVNKRLECYAQTQENVAFFNATDIFIYKDEFETDDDDVGTVGEYYVNKTLMNDFLHPSGEGAMLWGQAIVKKVKALIQEKGKR